MKHCDEFNRYGLLFLYGELNEEEEARYRRHSDECPMCSALLAGMEDTLTAYRAADADAPPVGLVQKTLAKLPKSRRRFRIPEPRFSFFAAGVCATAIVLFLLFAPWTERFDFRQKTVGELSWNGEADREIERLAFEIRSLETERDDPLQTVFSSWGMESEDDLEEFGLYIDYISREWEERGQRAFSDRKGDDKS